MFSYTFTNLSYTINHIHLKFCLYDLKTLKIGCIQRSRQNFYCVSVIESEVIITLLYMIECSPNLSISHGEKLLILWYSQIRKAKLLISTLQTAALDPLSLTCMKFGIHMYHTQTYKKNLLRL